MIEKDKMYVENANRASKEGYITVDNLEPNPKNPIIASFFRNIGYADQLGSGVRNLFKYTKFYSGREPEFREGDIFRIIVPLDDEYSFDFGSLKMENSISGINNLINETENADKMPISADKMPININGVPIEEMSAQEKIILEYIQKNEKITSHMVEELLGIKQRRARDILKKMVEKGILEKRGQYKSTIYYRGEDK